MVRHLLGLDTLRVFTLYYFGVWEPNLTAFIARRLHGQSERTFVLTLAHFCITSDISFVVCQALTSMPTGNVGFQFEAVSKYLLANFAETF